MRLTKASVKRLELPPGKLEWLVHDDQLPGFALRLRAGGSATWVFGYRVGQQQRRFTLGRYPALEVDEARAAAERLHAQVRLGQDPQKEKLGARAKAFDRPVTLGELVERYLKHAAGRQRPGTLAGTVRYLRVNFAPLLARPVETIGRTDVAYRLETIAGRSGGVTANRSRSALSAFYAWAMGRGLVESNPVIGTLPPAEERPRERVLTEVELRAVWQAAEGGGEYVPIVRLLILTGARREEVAGMTWDELDLERAEWTIPGVRVKNGREHRIPLSAEALAILQSVPRRSGRALLFGEGRGPFSGWSQAKRRLDERLREAAEAGAGRAKPMPPWRLHDIRRSVVTHMAELGILPHVIEAVVGHISGHKAGVAGVYNRAVYAAEKRQALDRWGQRVAEIVEGAERPKVVALHP